MWIIAGNALLQLGQTGLQAIAVLFFLNHPHGFAANHLGRRQIRLAEPETDAARLRAIRDLSDHALSIPRRNAGG